MAIAGVPPRTAQAMTRKRDARRAMNSPDPVLRFKAKEHAFNDAVNELGKVLVAEARKNAADIRKIEETEIYKITY